MNQPLKKLNSWAPIVKKTAKDADFLSKDFRYLIYLKKLKKDSNKQEKKQIN
jgi:hypothetical protein